MFSLISFGFEPLGDRGVTELASSLEHNDSLIEIRYCISHFVAATVQWTILLSHHNHTLCVL